MSKELTKKLAEIQQKLKAPKSQYNNFGKYAYRNCEDILEAVKPLLGDLSLVISDDVIVHHSHYEGETRFYVKATATISDGEHSIQNSAFAREEANKKGMDSSQLTGSTSSYARKYALNGLFLIDDTKDADATNNHGKKPAKEVSKPNKPAEKDSFKRPARAPKKKEDFDDI
jgi:hypothetical protein